ncbi:hypothetical protein K0M31_017131 [Melipona bicolor]|uniref:Uncharacterized protein n=1 Tax=Melipona bicolor TaxID=60889 RepID=A0AA40FDC2_9HYME|nr:hypothetical protein K0M31_017131 [Melipona bicolor]
MVFETSRQHRINEEIRRWPGYARSKCLLEHEAGRASGCSTLRERCSVANDGVPSGSGRKGTPQELLNKSHSHKRATIMPRFPPQIPGLTFRKARGNILWCSNKAGPRAAATFRLHRAVLGSADWFYLPRKFSVHAS